MLLHIHLNETGVAFEEQVRLDSKRRYTWDFVTIKIYSVLLEPGYINMPKNEIKIFPHSNSLSHFTYFINRRPSPALSIHLYG